MSAERNPMVAVSGAEAAWMLTEMWMKERDAAIAERGALRVECDHLRQTLRLNGLSDAVEASS